MKKILLIDMDDLSSNVINQIFEDNNTDILRSNDINDAIKIARDNHLDLIITDIVNAKDDLSFIKDLKQINPQTSIIVLSDDVSRNTIQKSYNNGCNGFLPKPIHQESFMSIISTFLEPNNTQEKSTGSLYNNFGSGEETVLIVDDNLMNAELLKATLEQLNINSVIALNGPKALDLLNKYNFDLILLDIMMPEMSGFEVIKKIKENQSQKDIPVIFVSAMNDPKEVVKGFDLGSFAYVKKPFNTEELKAQVVNILKIKRLQDSLKQEKDKLDTIYNYAVDGIVLLDTEFRIESCNQQFLKWLNLKNENEIIGMDFCEVTKCSSFNKENIFSCQCRNQMNNVNFVQTNAVMIFDNKPMNVKHSCSKIFDKAGHLKGYLCLLIDINKDIEIEQQKETFIATLTHDLKTPIRAEMQAMELLLKGAFGDLQPAQAEIIQEILFSNKFMFNMIDTLLVNYKYENGNIVLVKEDLDINALIRACHRELKYMIDERQHAVGFDFEKEKEIVHADPIELKRILMNLFSNAINYTHANGVISISSYRVGNNLNISFKDNGYGISEERLSHIFEKYNTNSKKFRHVGTGLGLYISKKIAELHGGTISVESEENVGSCFTFSIPIPVSSVKEKHDISAMHAGL